MGTTIKNMTGINISSKYFSTPTFLEFFPKHSKPQKNNRAALVYGNNGSGKSTIAKLLVGLLPQGSGEIYIEGLHLNEENLSDIRTKVGIVFQNPDNQFIGATVADDIAFGLENKCVEPTAMEEIINQFAFETGMVDYLNREPSKLSGGQKQRVAIAGVLAMAPDILIFD